MLPLLLPLPCPYNLLSYLVLCSIHFLDNVIKWYLGVPFSLIWGYLSREKKNLANRWWWFNCFTWLLLIILEGCLVNLFSLLVILISSSFLRTRPWSTMTKDIRLWLIFYTQNYRTSFWCRFRGRWHKIWVTFLFTLLLSY